MNDGELVGIFRREVGREHALLCAPPPQQLARCARRAAAPTPAAASATSHDHLCSDSATSEQREDCQR
jgi:hypothetical protein